LVNYGLKQGGKINYHQAGKKLEPYELAIVYLNALGGVKAFLASQAIQLSLAGVPGIYFGSLIGAQNWQEGVGRLADNRAINREKFAYQKLVAEIEDKNSVKGQVYWAMRRLIQARINEPLFSPLVPQKVVSFKKEIFGLMRFQEKEKLLSLTNVSEKTVEIESDLIIKLLEKDQVKDLISGQLINLKKSNVLTLNPYQVFWLRSASNLFD